MVKGSPHSPLSINHLLLTIRNSLFSFSENLSPVFSVRSPVADPLFTGPMKQHRYEFIFLAGLFGAVYLYGFSFDDFSETELGRLSYLWVAALVFGTHGLIASELNEIVASGQAATVGEAFEVRKKMEDRSFLSKMASVMMPSFRLLTAASDRKRPFFSAVLAAVLWTAGLAFFFEAIFPFL